MMMYRYDCVSTDIFSTLSIAQTRFSYNYPNGRYSISIITQTALIVFLKRLLHQLGIMRGGGWGGGRDEYSAYGCGIPRHAIVRSLAPPVG